MKDIFTLHKYVYIFIDGKRISQNDFYDKYGYGESWRKHIETMKDMCFSYGMTFITIEPVGRLKIRVVAR